VIKIEFYFDTETTGLNPQEDKIVTLQYQQIDKQGNPIGSLVILKEWELGEERLIRTFMSVFTPWDFIPVGMNLNFDFNFLINKIKKYTGKELTGFQLSNFPHIDIKSTLVLMNDGKFKGASLTNFTSKSESGIVIPKYYADKDYDKIINYVEDEAAAFVDFYKDLKIHLKNFKNN
jgi:DNA polymerase III alpha subunit (gram-positive type)